MRAIIIGAGRGSRLMPTTADTPKCFAEVSGQRLLDWAIDAFRHNGIDDIVFIGGYRIDCVRTHYPQLTFRENTDWPNNNILASLMFAEDMMDRPFVCCYSDVLFTPGIVRDVIQADADIALGVDSKWLVRYENRTDHPSNDAEKVIVENGLITRIHREIDEAQAHGEFIGLAKFSVDGAAAFRKHFHQRRDQYAGQPFREARVFEKAYLIHLLQDMIEAGQPMAHVDTPGGYIEVDTQQDFEYAREFWTSRHLEK
jgi:choline kinase